MSHLHAEPKKVTLRETESSDGCQGLGFGENGKMLVKGQRKDSEKESVGHCRNAACSRVPRLRLLMQHRTLHTVRLRLSKQHLLPILVAKYFSPYAALSQQNRMESVSGATGTACWPRPGFSPATVPSLTSTHNFSLAS